ncbi:MAG: MarR family transcriptional regulator [archaeon]|nr:MarR family transcriptional regulator [archaeon]
MSLDRVTEDLKKNPKGLNITQIAKLTGLSKSEISKTISRMESKGLIEKIVKGCRVTYKLKS